MALMQQAKKAKQAGPKFEKPDISQFIPPEMVDVVQRVVAAGMKIMYSPEMADERQQAVTGTEPIPKRISDNVLGLMLTIDQQANKSGGIPQAALFPVAVELAGEAANLLTTAGQEVSKEDFNDALLMLYAGIGKKLGGSDEELMGAAAQSMQDGGQVADDVVQASAQPPGATAPPQGAVPPAGAAAVPPGANVAPPGALPEEEQPVA